MNIILIKSGGGTGPVMPGNLINIKVLNPADYPKDEVSARFRIAGFFII